MSDPTVFDTPAKQVVPQVTPETVQPQSGDVFSDQLKEIKAEDGRQKYDTVEKALTALTHSQTLIPTLQQQVAALELEKTTLREELAKTKGVQEIVEQLTNHQQQGQEGNPSENQFGEEDIAKMIASTLDQRNVQAVQQTNASKVNDTLVSAYGDKAAEVVANKAKELNMTPEALGQLAQTSPDMVLALFQQKQTSTSVTSTSYNFGLQAPTVEPLKAPEKSLLSGASSKDQLEFMKRIKAEIYAKHGITE